MVLALEILVAVGILVMVVLFTRNQRPKEEHWPYAPKQLLTDPQRLLFRRLIEALPECYVFAQLPLAKVLDVRTGVPEQEWKSLISQKSLDFAICRQDSTIVAAVELSASSEDGGEHRGADETRDKALTDAGVKVLRWTASSLPDVAAIQAAFNA